MKAERTSAQTADWGRKYYSSPNKRSVIIGFSLSGSIFTKRLQVTDHLLFEHIETHLHNDKTVVCGRFRKTFS